MTLEPGQRIQWQDWRDEQWHNATVVAVERYHQRPIGLGHYREIKPEMYPFPVRKGRGTGEFYRLAIRVDFFADDPKYVWPWRSRGPDQIREVGDGGSPS